MPHHNGIEFGSDATDLLRLTAPVTVYHPPVPFRCVVVELSEDGGRTEIADELILGFVVQACTRPLLHDVLIWNPDTQSPARLGTDEDADLADHCVGHYARFVAPRDWPGWTAKIDGMVQQLKAERERLRK